MSVMTLSVESRQSYKPVSALHRQTASIGAVTQYNQAHITNMKLFATLLLSLFLSAGAFAQSERAPIIPADRVIAIVNTEAITQYEVSQRLVLAQQRLREQNITPPSGDALVKQVLERLIADKIQLQYAKESGMVVSDSDLDETVRRIAAGNNVSVPEMMSSVEKDGMSWRRFREDIREQIVLSRLRDREIDDHLAISDGEIDNYLASPPPPASAGIVTIAHVMVNAPEQVAPEQLLRLRARAEQALEQIKSGESFGKVAATFSDAPDALKGGQLEPRATDRFPPLYAEALSKMQPGDVSEVLRSPAGFHIIKLIDRQGGAQDAATFKQTHARHILIRVNELISAADARHKLDAVKERLNNGADFAELARLYSDDGSAAKGGDLGWVYQGDMVPDFERAMDGLKIGDVSDPVQTSFGLHLIQVLERRVDAGSKDRQRQAARKALRERKADDSYQDWLRQMRDQAYVEYRLEDR